jgi:hypothetical protein
MKKNEVLKITEEEMLNILKDKWKADAADMLVKIIKHARMMNFPTSERLDSLNRTMHGTDYLHGLLERKIITNELYQQLKRLAEDETITFDIVI